MALSNLCKIYTVLSCPLQADMSTRKQRWYSYRKNLPLLSRFILSFTIQRLYNIRNDFASRYIVNDGYEIGAQNSPLICKNAKKILYIDYLSKKESSQKYHIPEDECVDVDIIADANNLDSIPADSASFIIANHVLEHCPNPIGTLLGWLRILQTRGILFLTLPNYKSNEFDFEKTPATISHLVSDFERSKHNENITDEHIFEHIQIIDSIDPDNTKLFQQRYKAIVESNLHTHYHVFNKESVLDLLRVIHQQTPIQLVNTFSFDNSIELLFIIKKAPPNFRNKLITKQDRLFNFFILLTNLTQYLRSKILPKRQAH